MQLSQKNFEYDQNISSVTKEITQNITYPEQNSLNLSGVRHSQCEYVRKTKLDKM